MLSRVNFDNTFLELRDIDFIHKCREDVVIILPSPHSSILLREVIIYTLIFTLFFPNETKASFFHKSL